MNNEVALALSYATGLPPRDQVLLAREWQTPQAMARSSKEEVERYLGRRLMKEWRPGNFLGSLARDQRVWDQYRVRWLTIDDPRYPVDLRNIYDPPLVLFYRGNPPVSEEFLLGVVGTRRPSNAAHEEAYNFGRQCAALGVGVVSGLAYGIDSAVHAGLVSAGGRGICVLGSGVCVIAPQGNRALAGSLVQNGGCIVSEYPPLEGGAQYRYIQRNRIISGLSKGVVIVEAPEGSGALYTLDFALEQGREVALHQVGLTPGSRGEAMRLLRNSGATVIASIQELRPCFS